MQLTHFIDAKQADADAVVLLENIKIMNYKNINGFIGFDTNETKAIIKVFHLYKFFQESCS